MPLVQIDDFYHPYNPKCRWGFKKPPHPLLTQLFEKRIDVFAGLLSNFSKLSFELCAIPRHADSARPTEPHWENTWLPALDGIALYSFVSLCKPRYFVEVGSGLSTKFAAKAKRKNSPETKIISIDPQPRSEVNQLCDVIIRDFLQDVDPAFFDQFDAGDILFIDGSHRALPDSDVTVFFLEILPRLKPGILIGIHDILLPWDYFAAWSKRMYSEQYMLGAVLLAAENAYNIILPGLYVSEVQKALLQSALGSVLNSPGLKGLYPGGSAFWMNKKG